jgi:hypothetical protein
MLEICMRLTSSEEICEFARMSVHTIMVLLVRVSLYRLLASRTYACALSFQFHKMTDGSFH